MDNRCYTFAGGTAGLWSVTSVRAVTGASLPAPQRLAVHHAWLSDPPAGALWTLRGVTSNQRYVTRAEQTALQAVQGRVERTFFEVEVAIGTLIDFTGDFAAIGCGWLENC